jgi:predicted metallopeptidase
MDSIEYNHNQMVAHLHRELLKDVDRLYSHPDIVEYIKSFKGDPGFMHVKETKPERISLQEKMSVVLDENRHSGSSWGWALRIIQDIVNGVKTKQTILDAIADAS